MRRSLGKPFGAFLLSVGISGPLLAQDTAATGNTWLDRWRGEGHWRLAGSPYSHHWRFSDDHRRVWAIGLERQRPDNWLAGASYFSNSFGQESAYVYVGKRWPGLWGRPELFAQASGGVLYGYRGNFKDKVPLNYNGFSPGALVSLGWQYNRQLAFAAHVLGDAGVMFQVSYDIR